MKKWLTVRFGKTIAGHHMLDSLYAVRAQTSSHASYFSRSSSANVGLAGLRAAWAGLLKYNPVLESPPALLMVAALLRPLVIEKPLEMELLPEANPKVVQTAEAEAEVGATRARLAGFGVGAGIDWSSRNRLATSVAAAPSVDVAVPTTCPIIK